MTPTDRAAADLWEQLNDDFTSWEQRPKLIAEALSRARAEGCAAGLAAAAMQPRARAESHRADWSGNPDQIAGARSEALCREADSIENCIRALSPAAILAAASADALSDRRSSAPEAAE